MPETRNKFEVNTIRLNCIIRLIMRAGFSRRSKDVILHTAIIDKHVHWLKRGLGQCFLSVFGSVPLDGCRTQQDGRQTLYGVSVVRSPPESRERCHQYPHQRRKYASSTITSFHCYRRTECAVWMIRGHSMTATQRGSSICSSVEVDCTGISVPFSFVNAPFFYVSTKFSTSITLQGFLFIPFAVRFLVLLELSGERERDGWCQLGRCAGALEMLEGKYIIGMFKYET